MHSSYGMIRKDRKKYSKTLNIYSYVSILTCIQSQSAAGLSRDSRPSPLWKELRAHSDQSLGWTKTTHT